MEPENFTLAGVAMLAFGFIMAVFGGVTLSRAYFCAINILACSISATDIASELGYAIPLLIFGSFLIGIGTIFTAAGHITEHLRPARIESEMELAKPPLRVCVKCGRQVEPSAAYCPSCGNQLVKP